MFKKLLKIMICLAGIAAAAAGIYYFISRKKEEDNVSEESETSESEEDHLDAANALDLSSLKFSQHYVDLR